jgi:photosystem II stability/assembly factor-like uncharacterized protein
VKKKLAFLGILLLVLIFAAATQLMAVGTWTGQDSGTNRNLDSVDFVDATTGWAVGDTILHTTDGGMTWAAQNSGTTVGLYSVDFLDVNTGWVVGQSGTILHTTDGGAGRNHPSHH